jgi:hypothetical protein
MILEQLLKDSEKMNAYELMKKYDNTIGKQALYRLIKNLNYRKNNWKKECENLKKSLSTN